MNPLLSLLIGSAISIVASWIFYLLASKDLRRETERLRRYNIMLLHFLDDADAIDVTWGPNGEPIRIVEAEMTATAQTSVSMEAEVIRAKDKDQTAETAGTARHETDVVRAEEREAPIEASEPVEETERAEEDPRTRAGEAQATTQHQQAQRPTEGVEHDASTLREWTGDVEARRRSDAGEAQEGAQRPWWRRMFGL